MPLPHNLFDYCSIRKSNFIEKYLVVKRKISFVYKADILLTKLIIRGISYIEKYFSHLKCFKNTGYKMNDRLKCRCLLIKQKWLMKLLTGLKN